MHDPLQEFCGVRSGDVVGGWSGALVSLLFCEKQSMFRLFTTVLSGLAASIYVTPVLSWFLDIPEKYQHGIAFLLGLFAIALLRVVFVVIDKIRVDPSILLSRVMKK